MNDPKNKISHVTKNYFIKQIIKLSNIYVIAKNIEKEV